MKILQNILSLVIFVCVAALLIYIGVYIAVAVIVVAAIAFAWYGVKFYFLRKEIEKAMREHQGENFSDALRSTRAGQQEDNGPVIDGEFEEVDDSDNTKV
ncbi:MAG: hypothetical protein MK052_05030 [Alphaproteobacteria bacterium]|nr:hypothetical protein [Alphaproteobacteria bacterium]